MIDDPDAISVTVPPDPDVVAVVAEGPQGGKGEPGNPGPPGRDGDGATDPGDLTLLFENRLI